MEEGEVEQPKTVDEENKDNTTAEEEYEQEEKTPKPEEKDKKESQAQEQQKTHKKPTPEETRTADKWKVSEPEKQQKTYKPTPEKTPTQQKTADERKPEESRKTSKSYKNVVVGKQSHRKEKVKTGFLEHVATTRKRKEREEGDVHSRKQAREDENDDEATVMDIKDAPPSETEDPPPSEIENICLRTTQTATMTMTVNGFHTLDEGFNDLDENEGLGDHASKPKPISIDARETTHFKAITTKEFITANTRRKKHPATEEGVGNKRIINNHRYDVIITHHNHYEFSAYSDICLQKKRPFRLFEKLWF